MKSVAICFSVRGGTAELPPQIVNGLCVRYQGDRVDVRAALHRAGFVAGDHPDAIVLENALDVRRVRAKSAVPVIVIGDNDDACVMALDAGA
ncbi:MAG TPA: hypothetical protein VGC41_11615, partial [Kofleriaceae bacterium]